MPYPHYVLDHVALARRRATHTLASLAFALAALGSTHVLAPADAHATTYQVRTQSRARATQHLRSDRRWETSRTWTQAVHLSAYDLLDDNTGRLNARLSLRYFSDAALSPELGEDARALNQFNDLTLDLAYVDWRPFEALHLRAGRHWAPSALGVVDLDGLSAELASTEGATRPSLRVWAGRQVDQRLGAFDPATWDVQGLPLNDPYARSPQASLAGAALGVRHRRLHRMEIAASRTSRDIALPEGWESARMREVRQVEHRFGLSAMATPWQRLNVSTLLTFHGPAQAFDRALLRAALRAGNATTLSVGVDHRLPIFDAASIFNLFGAAPHQSAFMTVAHALPSLQSTVELRGWARAYRDSGGLADLGQRPDNLAPGAALATHHALQIFERRARLSAQLSYQTHSDSGHGGDQVLFDASLRVAATPRTLWLTARHTTLYASGAQTPGGSSSEESALALSTSLGAEVGLGDVARLSLLAEQRQGSGFPTHALLYANLTLELWP